ncbi:uncharacterized protein N0V89_004687 [Didymosphaeria variabile]|uniref:Uncharacterized protein n=1 Tax=Didymosphaeria variabile TaxID=1932322 RepID=A0A9W9CDT8_9PLEO|nr:uncharacterized protein N0V89_004687 [Didymosphaeria variabile]KAJ4356651.1 hypothetical protein N0V89_004687 [Didymosphaeria variabile]
MSRRRTNPSNHLRIALAHALGYDDYPNDLRAEPHLRYIENRHIGRGTLEEYLALFLRVIKHFSVHHEKPTETPVGSHSIRELLDAFTGADGEAMFADTKAGSVSRKEDVEDTVMYMVGTWAMLLSSFVQLPNGFRKVTLAYKLQAEVHKEAYDEDLAGLLRRSYLLPRSNTESDPAKAALDDDIVRTAAKLVSLLSRSSAAEGNSLLGTPSSRSLLTQSTLGPTRRWDSLYQVDAMDSLEAMAIRASRLNAFTLNVFAAVEISWTYNISRHMMLSRIGGRYVLELFALPCALNADSLTSSAVGISSELAQEIQESYLHGRNRASMRQSGVG